MPEAVDSQISQIIGLYINHNRDKYSPCTIHGKRSVLNKFCSFIFKEISTINELSVELVQKYIETKKHYKAKSLYSHLSIIIHFLRFLSQNNLCSPYIHASILRPTIWKYADIPCALPWNLIVRMPSLKVPKESCIYRNRAILYLLITYGMRAGEICNLKTTDLDWDANELEISRTKNYVSTRFPLDVEVGNAIAEYIKYERKNGDSKILFLYHNSSTKKISSHSIWNIVNTRLRILGYSSSGCRGSHAIRHAVAQHLLDNGVSYKEVRDILGHKHLTSTSIYAKINFSQLKSVALDKLDDLITANPDNHSFFQKQILDSSINLSINNIGDLL